ncbi:MAG: accessory gene regulator B family protein [Ruminococcus sp.]|nr:accessory gene regulator B family protein [Ruminococcus sp.]
MNRLIVEKVSKIFIDNKIVSENEESYLKYGLYLIISSVNTFISIIIISFLFGKVIVSIVFSCSFFVIRSLCGGYHCKSSFKCYITTLFVYFMFVLGTYLQQNIMFITTFLTSAFGIISILILAPITNINNLVSKKRQMISKTIVIILCVLHIVSLLYFKNIIGLDIRYAVSYTLAVVGVMLIIEKIRLSLFNNHNNLIDEFS